MRAILVIVRKAPTRSVKPRGGCKSPLGSSCVPLWQDRHERKQWEKLGQICNWKNVIKWFSFCRCYQCNAICTFLSKVCLGTTNFLQLSYTNLTLQLFGAPSWVFAHCFASPVCIYCMVASLGLPPALSYKTADSCVLQTSSDKLTVPVLLHYLPSMKWQRISVKDVAGEVNPMERDKE